MSTRWRGLLPYIGSWLVAFFLVLGLFQWEAMHALDLQLAHLLQSDVLRLDPSIVVDVPAEGGTVAFRQRLGDFLLRLAKSKEVPLSVSIYGLRTSWALSGESA